MAATEWYAFTHGILSIGNGAVDLDTDSFRVALVDAGWTPSQANDDAWSDISANERANGNGYTTHGVAVTSLTWTKSGLNATLDFADVSWASSTFTTKYAVLVHDADGNGALAAGDIPIAYCELEDGGTVSPSGATLSITMNASGVYQIQLTADP